MVVQALDKNNNQLWVECPVLTWERIQKEVLKAPSFLYVDVNRTDLLNAYRTDFERHNLQRFGSLRTRKAAIHSTTSLPKNKDNANKTRLICNQARSPWRSILRRVGKILSFLTIELSHRVRTFNLNRLDEIRSHLNRAYNTFSNSNTNDASRRTIKVFQFDVKQMFTWLAQPSTMQSLRFALANIIFNLPKSRNWKPVVYISKTLTNNGKYDTGWNRSYAPQDYIAFTFDDIYNIVSLDFAHSHFIIGDAVFVQKDGCPIGGYLSSPLAQMKCMCDEAVLIRPLLTPSSSKHFYGIRQVDDLLLLILANWHDELEVQEA
eukprot:g82475.t1